MVEIVSPGNKASKNELRTFVEKTSKLIAQGVHLLVIDLFPPSKRDPQGIHKAIWDEFVEEDFALPADQRLTLAAYDAGRRRQPTSSSLRSESRCRTCRFFSSRISTFRRRWRKHIGSRGMISFPPR